MLALAAYFASNVFCFGFIEIDIKIYLPKYLFYFLLFQRYFQVYPFKHFKDSISCVSFVSILSNSALLADSDCSRSKHWIFPTGEIILDKEDKWKYFGKKKVMYLSWFLFPSKYGIPVCLMTDNLVGLFTNCLIMFILCSAQCCVSILQRSPSYFLLFSPYIDKRFHLRLCTKKNERVILH